MDTLTFPQCKKLLDAATTFHAERSADESYLFVLLPEELIMRIWPCVQRNELDYVLTVLTPQREPVARYATREPREMEYLDAYFATHYAAVLDDSIQEAKELDERRRAQQDQRIRTARTRLELLLR